MTENFQGRADQLSAPARCGFAIAPSDTTDLTAETRAIYVGTGGDLTLMLASGDQITLTGIGGGMLLPVRARRVQATGTSAAQLVGLY